MQNYMTCTFIRQTPFSHQPLFEVTLKGGCLTQVSLYYKILHVVSDETQTNGIEAFNSTSRHIYYGDMLNIGNNFDQVIGKI